MGSIPQYVRSAKPEPRCADAPAATKLLLPVDATDRSRWSIVYAISLHERGTTVEVHLLFVAEPITSWQVLRFRTQAETIAFQRQYGQWQLDDALVPLRQSGITVRTHLREGDIPFEILDCAEQLACDQIVLPRPYPRWMRLLGTDVVREVVRRAAVIPVVTVDQHGVADQEVIASGNS
jgi:hypothetical protein